MTPEAIDLNKNPVLGMLMNTQAFNTKIVELAGTNFNSAVKYAEKVSKVRSGREFAALMVDQVRDQFEAMSEQVEELSATIRGVSLEDDAAGDAGLGD
jgi:methyl-accepting chemotaxis protein